MPSLSEILNDPNYVNANEETKAAIFTKYAPLDENYTQANAATQAAIRGRFGVEGQPGIGAQGGFDTALYSGYQNLKGGLAGLAGRIGMMDIEKAKQIQEETEEKGKKAFKPTEEGWLTAPGTKFAETLGQSLPSMVAPIAAAGIATVAGAPGIAATGLSALASAIQFTGSNLQRQQERGVELEDTSIGGAIAAAIPQTALETLSFRMIPGVQKLFGKAGKEITEAQAAEIAKQGIVRSTAAYGAQGARTGGIEGATEVGQQFLERLQAGLETGNQDAINEYVESFIGGAVLGGALQLPGTAMRRDQARQMAAQQQAVTPPDETAPEPVAAPEVQDLSAALPVSEARDVEAQLAEYEGRQLPLAPSPAGVVAQPAQIAQPEIVQGELPGEPAPAPISAPVAQVAQPSPEDIVPLDDKGKPIEEPKAAAPKEPAKLDPNVEAQLAAEPFDPDSIILPPKEEPPVRAPKAAKPKASEKILSAHEFIASLGGLDKQEASEINKDDAKPNVRIGNKWLYASKGGLSAAQAAEKLAEAGYIDTEDSNEVYRVINDSLVDPVYSINDADAVAERKFAEQEEENVRRYEQKQKGAALEAQDISAEVAAEQATEAADLGNFRQQMLDAGYTEQDLNVIGFTKASPELQAEVAALQQTVSAAGLDPAGILETLEGELANRDITRQEYYANAKTRLEKAIQEQAVQGGGRDVSQADVQEGAAREEGLTSPTEKELKDKQEAADKAAADKARADRDAAAKEKADAERKEVEARSEKAAAEFELGKTAEEDLSGQKDVFSTPVQISPEQQKIDALNAFEANLLKVAPSFRAVSARGASSLKPKPLSVEQVRLIKDLAGKAIDLGMPASVLKNVSAAGATRMNVTAAISEKNGWFLLGNQWSASSLAEKLSTVIHELGHSVDNKKQADVGDKVSDGSLWKKAHDELKNWYDSSATKRTHPLNYPFDGYFKGKVRPKQESFAQAFSLYFVSPVDLQTNAPEAYSQIQSIVEGIQNESQRAGATGAAKTGAAGVNVQPSRAEKGAAVQPGAGKVGVGISKSERVEDRRDEGVEDVDLAKSPEFKKWFDDSKVVDEDGNPLAMYHSTYSSFPKFTTNFGENEYFQFGIHIGTQEAAENRLDLKRSEDQARGVRAPDSGANIIPLYASIKNPLRLDENRSGRWGVDDIMNAVMQKADETGIEGISNENLDDFYNDRFDIEEWAGLRTEPGSPDYDPESIDRSWSDVNEFTAGERSSLLKVFLKQLGYDGIVYKNEFEGGGDSYIALDSNQVKSVFNLRPTKSENISFAKKPAQPTLSGIESKPAIETQIPKAKPAPTWKSLEEPTWKDTWAIRLFDKNLNLDQTQKEIEKTVKKIKDEMNAYRLETLSHGKIEASWNDFMTSEFSPIIKEMKANKITDEALTEYLVMRHAKEANDLIAERNPNNPAKQDKGSGISYEDRDKYFEKLDPAKQKQFESIASKVDSILQKTRNMLEQGGIITKENREAWENMFEFYVPLRREESDYSLPSSSYRKVGDFAKSRTGSSKDVIDVLSNIAINREIAINRIEQERIRRAVYGLALTFPNPNIWMAVSPDAVKNRDVLAQEIQDQFGMDSVEADSLVDYIMTEPNKEYFDKNTGRVVTRTDVQARYKDYVLPVKINGKDRFVFFNPKDPRAMQMVQSLKGLDAKQLPYLMAMVAPVTRFFSSVNTQFNLVFGAWNFARDIQGAQLNLSTTAIADRKMEVLKGTFKAMPEIYKALREMNAGKSFSDKSDGSWSDFIANGGKVGYKDQFARLTQSENLVNKELKKLDRGNAKKAAYATLNYISNINDVLENSTRLSAYRAALSKFKSEHKGEISGRELQNMKERAADIAKNLTVNFNRKGTWGATAGSLYAFFNASAQGTKRLYETLSGPNGKKIMAAGIAIGMVQAIGLAMAGFDEDEPTEFIKQKNLIIPTGDGGYAMWPMPFGFSIFPNLGRLFVESLSRLSKGKDVTDQFVNTITMLANSFNPLGGGGLLQTIAPTVLDPIAALAENRDAFGRPISRESRGTAPKPGYTLSRDPSMSISQFLAEFVNTVTFGNADKRGLLSPTADQIDYLAGQIGGGVYRELSRAGKYAGSVIDGTDVPESQVPIAGKIVGNINSPQAISQRFYKNVVAMSEHEDAIKGRIKRRESVSEYMRDNPEASMWRRANALEVQISKLNATRREKIQKDAPVAEIKKIDDQKTRMMKQFNADVRKREAQ